MTGFPIVQTGGLEGFIINELNCKKKNSIIKSEIISAYSQLIKEFRNNIL